MIGTIQLELTEWDTRSTAAEIGEEIRAGMADIAGIDVQVQTASAGPSAGKPVSLRIRARDPATQEAVVEQVRDTMDRIGGFTDVTDTRPLPVLIDTYNDLKKRGQSPLEAALRTGAQRLRPVMLTSATTALGLMPMVIGLNIDFFDRSIVHGAPSTQWWTELSSAIAGGLLIARW